MAQALVAAVGSQSDKSVKTLHTIFARGGSVEAPVDIVVDVMHAGRSFGSATLTVRQGDRSAWSAMSTSATPTSSHRPASTCGPGSPTLPTTGS